MPQSYSKKIKYILTPVSRDERASGSNNMLDFDDLRAAIDRLRAAAGSLTDPHDVAVVAKYLRELERKAAKGQGQNQAMFGCSY